MQGRGSASAKLEEQAALAMAADVPYWRTTPDAVTGNRRCATLLRYAAEELLAADSSERLAPVNPNAFLPSAHTLDGFSSCLADPSRRTEGRPAESR